MKRIIVDSRAVPGTELALSEENNHYLRTVLRLTVGDSFILIDDTGQGFLAVLTDRDCLIREQAPIDNREPTVDVELYLPLLKGDKLELVIQKSVELGVNRIILYEAARSVVRITGNFDRKLARWQLIATNAVQQCRRNKVPEIIPPRKIGQLTTENKLSIFAWEQHRQFGLAELLTPVPQAISILSGPEGGLTGQEADLLVGQNWQPVTLGPRILRAETAAIAMLASVMFACGQMR